MDLSTTDQHEPMGERVQDIPVSVPSLVESAIRSGEVHSPVLPPPTRGQATREDRLKIRAFERYLEGRGSLGDIAKEIGCSRQYLYKLARVGGWAERRAKVQTMALMNTTVVAEAVEQALTELRVRVPQRLLELEDLCVKRNLTAILAWLRMAGLSGKPVESETPPATVEVHNDLSDRRQVTVIQEGARTPELENVAESATGDDQGRSHDEG